MNSQNTRRLHILRLNQRGHFFRFSSFWGCSGLIPSSMKINTWQLRSNKSICNSKHLNGETNIMSKCHTYNIAVVWNSVTQFIASLLHSVDLCFLQSNPVWFLARNIRKTNDDTFKPNEPNLVRILATATDGSLVQMFRALVYAGSLWATQNIVSKARASKDGAHAFMKAFSRANEKRPHLHVSSNFSRPNRSWTVCFRVYVFCWQAVRVFHKQTHPYNMLPVEIHTRTEKNSTSPLSLREQHSKSDAFGACSLTVVIYYGATL